MDRHIGHSRNVARIHYEMIQKEMDACKTSAAVDRVINVISNEDSDKGNGENEESSTCHEDIFKIRIVDAETEKGTERDRQPEF